MRCSLTIFDFWAVLKLFLLSSASFRLFLLFSSVSLLFFSWMSFSTIWFKFVLFSCMLPSWVSFMFFCVLLCFLRITLAMLDLHSWPVVSWGMGSPGLLSLPFPVCVGLSCSDVSFPSSFPVSVCFCLRRLPGSAARRRTLRRVKHSLRLWLRAS